MIKVIVAIAHFLTLLFVYPLAIMSVHLVVAWKICKEHYAKEFIDVMDYWERKFNK